MGEGVCELIYVVNEFSIHTTEERVEKIVKCKLKILSHLIPFCHLCRLNCADSVEIQQIEMVQLLQKFPIKPFTDTAKMVIVEKAPNLKIILWYILGVEF